MGFRQKKISYFLDKLGSDSGSPGGGAAAALTAAIGIALVEMVVRINSKRKNPTGGKSKAARLKTLRRRMESVMDRDAAVFSKLSKLLKAKNRGTLYQTALKAAAAVPFVICKTVPEGLRLAKSEAAFTGRWLMSDLVESESLLKAAFFTGKLNVEINLNEIEDQKFVLSKRRALAVWEKKL